MPGSARSSPIERRLWKRSEPGVEVASAGKPLTLKSTTPVNPFKGKTHTAFG